MTYQCSFCKGWFDDKLVLCDLNNNKYCKECARERLFKNVRKLMKEGKNIEAIKELQKALEKKTTFYDKYFK